MFLHLKLKKKKNVETMVVCSSVLALSGGSCGPKSNCADARVGEKKISRRRGCHEKMAPPLIESTTGIDHLVGGRRRGRAACGSN